jgi:hypothetical protein
MLHALQITYGTTSKNLGLISNLNVFFMSSIILLLSSLFIDSINWSVFVFDTSVLDVSVLFRLLDNSSSLSFYGILRRHIIREPTTDMIPKIMNNKETLTSELYT